MQLDPKVLSKAVDISFAKFDPMRRARGRFLAQMAGRFYGKKTSGDHEASKASPLNLIYTAVTTLLPQLIYNDPRVKISTDILPYRQYADILSMAGNHLVKKINLRMTLRKTILDAIFMAGFIKTGIAHGDDFITMENGEDVSVGQPFAERIDPDDMILDPIARDWDEQQFIGNRFRVSVDDLLESGLYDEDAIKALPGTYDGNSNDKDQSANIMGGREAQQYASEVERYVDLVELYIPKQKVIVTLPFQKDAVADQFLRVAEYDGPPRGPYHMLGFTPMSNNILPVAPAGMWYDLHILGNRIARKLARQAERIKRVLAYTDEAGEDVEQLAEADDGETVKVKDVNQIKEVQYGGAGNDSYNWMEWVKKEFSTQSGNTDLLSGSSTNSPTATQAEMLQSNTSVRLSDMQNSVYDFTEAVSGDLIYYLHTDPLISLPLVQEQNSVDPMTGMPSRAPQQIAFQGGEQQGEWLDYNIKVKPYSMARPDPNQQVRRKLEFATNVIPAAAQATSLLGPGFMIGPFLKRMAEETGIDDADEFINDAAFQQWMMMRLQMNTGDPGKAGQGMMMPQLGGLPPQGQPMNPGQPNPQAYGPSGGTSPDQQQNAAQQEAAGHLQRGRVSQPSASALAQTMST